MLEIYAGNDENGDFCWLRHLSARPVDWYEGGMNDLDFRREVHRRGSIIIESISRDQVGTEWSENR